jgi:hypothetical protein
MFAGGWTRSVSARLVERFIFNFRVSPNCLAERLPVSWLEPQVLNGWSIVSFCILKIQRLMLRPIPSVLGFETICCAYRCGVIDQSGLPSPSVYILGRNTDSPFVSLMAPLILESPMPPVTALIRQERGYKQIKIRFGDGRPLFSAKLYPSRAEGGLKSKAFGSLSDFIDFIKLGVSSYAKSSEPGRFSRIDLHKEDSGYESMESVIEYNKLDYDWQAAGIEYDSVVRVGGGGLYVWTFKGKTPLESQPEVTKEMPV